MRRLERLITGLVAATDERLDRVRARRRARRPVSDRIRIVPFAGYGTADALAISGRVLTDDLIAPARDGDSWRTHLRNMLRRLESDEVPGAVVRVHCGDSSREVVADAEGYFHAEVLPSEPVEANCLWHEVDLELVAPLPTAGAPPRSKGRVLVPPPSSRFGVVSDVDDTVIWTDVTHKLRMAKIVFFDGARARLPFEGVASLYHAFRAGATGAEDNPIFYVSGSPWNLYDFLVEVFEVHGIPHGPVRLRDFGSSPSSLLWKDTAEHKLEEIRAIFERYPALPFILVGDSGERDPEIYRAVVGDYPSRVLAVYIRNVTKPEREGAIEKLAAEVRAAGSDLVLARDSRAAAEHAASRGWILPVAGSCQCSRHRGRWR